MRSKNPELMKKITDYINEFFATKLRSPSINEVAIGVGVAKTTAYRYLVAMNNLGMISYNGQSIETPRIDKSKTRYFSAPVVGSIRCGDPETEEEFVEEYISLPESIFGKGEFYILRATGDSMVDVGIDEGDLVLIKKQSSAEVGDIVVALDESNENTLKTYAGIDAVSGCAILRYENKSNYQGKSILVKELIIQGVAKHIIKSL